MARAMRVQGDPAPEAIDYIRALVLLHGGKRETFSADPDLIQISIYSSLAGLNSQLSKRALDMMDFNLSGSDPYSHTVDYCVALVADYELGRDNPPPKYGFRSSLASRRKLVAHVFSPMELRELQSLSRKFHENLKKLAKKSTA